jgi:hypothetical protein
VDMVVDEEAGVVRPHMLEVEALMALIKRIPRSSAAGLPLNKGPGLALGFNTLYST